MACSSSGHQTDCQRCELRETVADNARSDAGAFSGAGAFVKLSIFFSASEAGWIYFGYMTLVDAWQTLDDFDL